MAAQIGAWVERYPIVSVEDGLAEEDWAHWPLLYQTIGKRALVLGDCCINGCLKVVIFARTVRVIAYCVYGCIIDQRKQCKR